MSRISSTVIAVILAGSSAVALGQSSPQSSGTLVIVPAFGEVKHVNDEAYVTLMIEEQDRDKSAAASRVNQKMKQGVDIVKREDPSALLTTRGYYTYPVYAEEQQRQTGKPRLPTGWRVGQFLEVKTNNLDGLPKTVAAAQKILAVNGLRFGLSDTTSKKLDEQRINATYRNLTERIGSIAKAMGRNPADAILDTVDFDGSGAYAQQGDGAMQKTMMRASAESAAVEEPSFERGETTLQMRLVGKFKFK